MWPGVYARTGLTLACSQREKVGAYAACQCLHWPPFMSCTLLYVPPTWPFRWGLVPYIHTYIHTCIHTYTHTYIHTYLGAPRHFAWQAWHLVTSTLITCKVVLRGRRLTDGTWWQTPWFHVARGLAQSHVHDASSWSWLYTRYDYQPQGMQKEFAKFAASPERVRNITLVSGSMESTPSLW